MGTKFQINISGTSSIGSMSVQREARAVGSVTVVTSGESSAGIPTPQTIATGGAKITLEQGAVVGDVSMQPGVPAKGEVTISPERLPRLPSSSV